MSEELLYFYRDAYHAKIAEVQKLAEILAAKATDCILLEERVKKLSEKILQLNSRRQA